MIPDSRICVPGNISTWAVYFCIVPYEVIERSWLQKEIWEDEGVIVGRSLDMFISKLRKKLEFDLNIKIAVIQGKGYKLEISA